MQECNIRGVVLNELAQPVHKQRPDEQVAPDVIHQVDHVEAASSAGMQHTRCCVNNTLAISIEWATVQEMVVAVRLKMMDTPVSMELWRVVRQRCVEVGPDTEQSG